MYRRLILFGIAVVASALVALVIPLALVARDVARSEHLQEVTYQAREVSVRWQQASASGEVSLSGLAAEVDYYDGAVTLLDPAGDSYGPAVPDEATAAVAAARQGASSTIDTGGAAYAVDAVPLPDGVGVVLLSTTPEEMREGLLPRLLALVAVSLTLLVLAGAAAWLLARRTVQPIQRLAATADAIADGDLSPRVEPTAIPEVNDVGRALNRMAGRVQELLADERVAAAELAHQLRTPLTVLAADIDSVTDPEVRSRLQDDALALQRQTDEIIATARRTTREGLRAECDAAVVVAERASFWQLLAEDQQRPSEVAIEEGPLPVRLTAEDLGTVLDILLQNVFIHTPEGVGYRVSAAPLADTAGAVLVEVSDEGPGLQDRADGGERTGSSGLGLSIASKLAAATGGRLTTDDSGGGLAVRVVLGPPGAAG